MPAPRAGMVIEPVTTYEEVPIVTEAARGIYDASIDEALPKLASLVDRSKLSQPAWRRVVNANARVGTPENALALARLASRVDVPDPIRVEALGLLAEWPKPSGRDPVTGLWRPRAEHPAKEAADALEKVYGDLLKTPSERVQIAALSQSIPLLDAARRRQVQLKRASQMSGYFRPAAPKQRSETYAWKGSERGQGRRTMRVMRWCYFGQFLRFSSTWSAKGTANCARLASQYCTTQGPLLKTPQISRS